MKKYIPIILLIILAGLLRIVALDKYPAGLNADEAAIGYNAWSLLETGKDEHSISWPLVFRSFDDYKPPVYFYLVLPFVKFFGLNVWSVRLPSAILGTLSVLLLYLILKKSFSKQKYLAEIAALLLATSPWHLQFARGGWEVNAALFFILLGIYGFYKGLENPKYYFLFVIPFAVSLYTYHSARLISPLLALVLVIIYWKDIFNKETDLKLIILSVVLGVGISLPLAAQMLSKEGQSRFTGVSVFSDSGPLWQALEMRRGHENTNLYVKIVHNQYLSYGLRFFKNYLSHFSPRFLFVTGDEIARSRVPGMGQSYLFLFPFVALGFLSLLTLDTKAKKFFLAWLLISPIAAAMTFQSPHALRAQNMVIPLTLITSLGLISFFRYTDKMGKILSNILVFLTLSIGAYATGFYLHQYYVHYPKELPYAWQYGFDQIAQYTKANYDKYDKIIISDRYDQPYILMAFFLKYPPEILQKELVMTPRDKFGFSTCRKFGKYEFRSINYNEDKKLPNTLIIAADEPVDNQAIIHRVYDPAGKTMYKFLSAPSQNLITGIK